MKKSSYVLPIVWFLLLLCLASCHADKAEPSATDPKTLEPQYCIRMLKSIEECMENADYVVTCTVTEIGDAYLSSPREIDENDPESVVNYIRSIRTPITLTIHDIYYDSTESLGETLTLTDYRGTYNGYTLKSRFPALEESLSYLLFIAIAPDGQTNIAIAHGTSMLDPADTSAFTPLFNEYVFEGLASLEDVRREVARVADTKK